MEQFINFIFFKQVNDMMPKLKKLPSDIPWFTFDYIGSISNFVEELTAQTNSHNGVVTKQNSILLMARVQYLLDLINESSDELLLPTSEVCKEQHIQNKFSFSTVIKNLQ